MGRVRPAAHRFAQEGATVAVADLNISETDIMGQALRRN